MRNSGRRLPWSATLLFLRLDSERRSPVLAEITAIRLGQILLAAIILCFIAFAAVFEPFRLFVFRVARGRGNRSHRKPAEGPLCYTFLLTNDEICHRIRHLA